MSLPKQDLERRELARRAIDIPFPQFSTFDEKMRRRRLKREVKLLDRIDKLREALENAQSYLCHEFKGLHLGRIKGVNR